MTVTKAFCRWSRRFICAAAAGCLIPVIWAVQPSIVAAEEPPAPPATQPAAGPVTPANRPFRVATDFPSIQAAIDSLPDTGGTVYIPEGRYVLDKALDFTRRNYHVLLREEEKKNGIRSRTNQYVHLMGAGNGTILEGRMKEGPVIDMTDSSFCSISQLQIQSRTAQCGILLARPHPKNRKNTLLSCGWHTFYSVNINGSYSVAAVYNQASEVDRWYGCQFGNTHPDAYVFVFSYRNFAGIVSPYAGELCEIGSNADQRLNGCLITQHCGPPADKENPKGATIYVQGWAEDFTLADCDFGVGANVKAAIWLDGERNPCKGMHLTNNRIENKAKHLLLATGYNVLVDFTGNTCPGAGTSHIEATGKAEYWNVSHNMLVHSATPGTPTMRFASLSRSTIDHNWCDPKPAAGQSEPAPQIRVSGECEESEIMVPQREAFDGKLARSRLIALNDAGVRRDYLGAGDSGTVLNFTPTDTAKCEHPKKGDVALDDGTNTKNHKAGLAVFDGREWSYSN